MKTLLLSVISLFIVLMVAAQQPPPAHKISIDSALGYVKENFPQEKVILQTDKNVYTWDETIWMKLWCVSDGLPSYLSRIVYVDMVDANGKVVLKKMYRLDSLSSTGADFDMNDNIKSGNYSVRAYTLWMLNFPQYIGTKNIFVYGTDYKIAAKKLQPAIKMNFFAEGGNLIEGIENSVAFKITDANGYAVNINGFISDASGKKVADFSTEHDGMGAFTLIPEKGKSYLSNIVTSAGATLQFKLPQVLSEGVNMHVNNSANRFTVLLGRGDLNKEKYGNLKVVAVLNGSIVYAQSLNLEEGQVAAAIPKKNLAAGLMQVTIFSKDDIPLCERVVFVENYNIIKPQVSTSVVSTKPRALNKLNFAIPQVVQPSLLVSITDATGVADSAFAESNIASGLLLTSDVKGYINNPAYYVKDKSVTTLKHLDLLLMTQGWRQYEWKKILNGEFTKLKYPVESSISISGLVTKSDREEIIKKGFVSFIIKTSDSATILAEAKITDKGEFMLNDLNFKKNASVAYMGTDENKKKYIVDVKLNSSYLDSLKSSSFVTLTNSDTIDLSNAKAGIASFLYDKLKTRDAAASNFLGEVTVKTKKISPIDSLNKEYADGPFLLGRGINPADYKNYRTIWQIIQAAVPGVTVEGNPFDPSVSFNRFDGLNALSDNNTFSDEETGVVMETKGIAYFLNGINVTKDVINTLSVDDIALIKVLKQEASVLGATQGAIAIYTKSGATVGANPYDKTYTKMEKQGYALVKKFYSPDYIADPFLDKNSKDTRYLLKWNADPLPSKDGKYNVTFFNNDSAKKFKIIIQGLDKDGKLVYTEQVLQ